MLVFPHWRFTGSLEVGSYSSACRATHWSPPDQHRFAPIGVQPPYLSPQSDDDSTASSASGYSLESSYQDWQSRVLPNAVPAGTACVNPPTQAPSTYLECKWRECSRVFPTLDNLSQHVASNHAASGQGGLFYCGWHGCLRGHRGFNARYKMLVHVRTHTNEKPHQCEQCEKSFSRAENLKIHIRSHSGEKPYVCPFAGCTKAYSNSSDRFKHTRTHSVDKPYSCKIPGCDKRYTDPSSLRKHVKTYKHFTSSAQTAYRPAIEERVPPVYFDIDPFTQQERIRSISYTEGTFSTHIPHQRLFPTSCPSLSCQNETSTHPPLEISDDKPLNLKRRSTSESAVARYENGALNLEKRPRLSFNMGDNNMPLDLSNKN